MRTAHCHNYVEGALPFRKGALPYAESALPYMQGASSYENGALPYAESALPYAGAGRCRSSIGIPVQGIQIWRYTNGGIQFHKLIIDVLYKYRC